MKNNNKFEYEISILNRYKGYRFLKKKLIKTIFDIVLDDVKQDKDKTFFMDAKKIVADFVFCSDDEIQEINREYRGIDKPTDVITFALFADCADAELCEDELHLGEIIISIDTAKRQAKNTLEEELVVLITHGFLHLLGFDHQTDEDYNFVVGVQKRTLETLKNGKISIN